MERRYIVDTTLRDGEQAPGLAFTHEETVALARIMDSGGVYLIEAGIPAMGPFVKTSICSIMENRKHSLISAWNRMDKADIDHSIDCQPDIIHISAPVSYPHIYTKLRKNKGWLAKQLESCVEYACNKGFRVSVGFEDASRADVAFMYSLAMNLKKYNLKSLRIADTVGVLTPTRAGELVASLAVVGIPLELHMHNSLGMAVANSFRGARAGAEYVDCSVLGIGEKGGNCNMRHFTDLARCVYDVGLTRRSIITVEQFLKGCLDRHKRAMK